MCLVRYHFNLTMSSAERELFVHLSLYVVLAFLCLLFSCVPYWEHGKMREMKNVHLALSRSLNQILSFFSPLLKMSMQFMHVQLAIECVACLHKCCIKSLIFCLWSFSWSILQKCLLSQVTFLLEELCRECICVHWIYNSEYRRFMCMYKNSEDAA